MYSTRITTDLDFEQVSKRLEGLKELHDIIEFQIEDGEIELVSSAQSYAGFGLTILVNHRQSGIELSSKTRHDFNWFNLILLLGFIVGLILEKITFLESIFGLSLLFAFDVIFTWTAWNRLRKKIKKLLAD